MIKLFNGLNHKKNLDKCCENRYNMDYKYQIILSIKREIPDDFEDFPEVLEELENALSSDNFIDTLRSIYDKWFINYDDQSWSQRIEDIIDGRLIIGNLDYW